jgi:glycosyltransferase involved in cell wall biosynthesis
MQTGVALKAEEKLRSLHIIGSRQMGGAESFYLRLIRALNEHGDQSALAVIRPNSPLRQVLGQDEEQFHVPMRNGWDLFSMLSIRRLIRETDAQIVQSYMGRGSRLTRLPKESPAVHVARLGGFYKIDGYYRHAHAWVGNTRELCDYLLRQGLPGRRIYHIGNFVESALSSSEEELQEVRRSLEIPAEAIVLFSLGRFIGIKGFDDLLSAFARLASEFQGRPLFLVIAGDGPLRQALLNQCRELGLEKRVRWAGWQSCPGPYFDMADIFVCPSSHETLGNVILEAWSHGLPVVSTRTPGGLELIAEGENGLLAPCKDPGGLADRLSELLEEGPSAWSQLGEKGARELKIRHGKEAVVGQYLAMYHDLLQNRS